MHVLIDMKKHYRQKEGIEDLHQAASDAIDWSQFLNPSVNYEEGGVLLIDKPLYWTSFDVVRKIRGLLKIKKVGQDRKSTRLNSSHSSVSRMPSSA